MAQDTPLGFPAHTLPYRRGESTTLLIVSAMLLVLRLLKPGETMEGTALTRQEGC